MLTATSAAPPDDQSSLFHRPPSSAQTPLDRVPDHHPNTGPFEFGNTAGSQVSATPAPQNHAPTPAVDISNPVFQFPQFRPTTQAQNNHFDFQSKLSAPALHAVTDSHEDQTQKSRISPTATPSAVAAFTTKPLSNAQSTLSFDTQQSMVPSTTDHVQCISEHGTPSSVSGAFNPAVDTMKSQLKPSSVQDRLSNPLYSSSTTSHSLLTPVNSSLDHEKATEVVARLGLQQHRGLLQQFVEFYLSDTLNMLTQNYNKKLRNAETGRVPRSFRPDVANKEM